MSAAEWVEGLRIECTANDATFFKPHRKPQALSAAEGVEHKDGTSTCQVAPLKKSIHSTSFMAG